MNTPEPSDDRTEWDADATLFEGPSLEGLLPDLTPAELEDVREAVAGIGGRSSSTCPTRLESLGPYRDLEEIGRGGMGVVYRAIEPATGEPVAVKIPSPHLTGMPNARRRFILEAEVVGRLKHPGVVPHIKSGEDRGRWYIVSEFCDGPNLEAWLKHRNVPVPPREAARLIRILADAVEHAHGRNVLHRDIKPSNILLPGARPTSDAEDLSPRLTDFGLAKLIDAGLETVAGQGQAATRTGMLIGSPPYMAPEMASDGRSELDRRTDVYGLGAVLYELLTGRPPFRGENSTETLRMVLHDEPIPVRVLRPGAPKPLETIALQCLEKDPARRYAKAGELRDDLDRYLAGRRILARPLGKLERLRRWSHRRPRTALGLTASLALALLLIGGIAAWNLSLRRLVEELRESKDSLDLNEKMLQQTIAELRQERDRADRNTDAAETHYYGSQIQVAAKALQEGHLGRVQQILRDLIPEPGGTDRRGFAWRYLWRTARREAQELPGLDNGLDVGALSPDERWLAVANRSPVRCFGIYDLTRERFVWSLSGDPDLGVFAVAFSPDGKLVAFGLNGRDRTAAQDRIRIEVRDVGSGEFRGRMSMESSFCFRSLAFDDSGRVLAAACADAFHGIPGVAAIVRWTWGEGLDRAPDSVTPIRWLAASRDGLRHAAIDPEGRLAVYDAPSGAWIATLPDAPTGSLMHVDFGDDDRRLAVARTEPRDLTIFDVATGRRLHTYPDLPAPAVKVSLQPGGEGVLVIGEDREVRLLDHSRGVDVVIYGPTDAVGVRTSHLRYISDGSAFLAHRSEFTAPDHFELRSSVDGRLLGESPGRIAQATEGAWVVRSLDRQSLIYGIGRHVWRWDWERTLAPDDATMVQAHRDEVWGVAYSADGSIRATVANNDRDMESIKLWDARSGRFLRSWKGHDATVSDLAFSPDGAMLATTSLAVKDPIRLWEVPSGREIAVLDLPDDEPARAVAFDPSGRRIYVGGDWGTLFAWDVSRKRDAWTAFPPGEEPRGPKSKRRFHDLAVSPDGLRLASVDDSGRVRVRDAETGGMVAEYASGVQSFAVRYSPDGGSLAVADREGRILILEAESARLVRTINGDDIELRALAYSPDGRTLAAGGLGRVVRLWDPKTGDELLTLTGHEAQINAVTFSPDGDTLISADHSGVLRFWRARDDAPR
ncbi:WD40 repeat domain-containing serine/threonine protein kinase [Paludisphaera soli]|uniref:WD40 repeat domain-containing serine/threonine protein kinase n=1 Tax=Paludisphaera soli TaxID=2712865 RepID=UPI0013ED559E|nr:protein kinase [Paludisphaera soli]